MKNKKLKICSIMIIILTLIFSLTVVSKAWDFNSAMAKIEGQTADTTNSVNSVSKILGAVITILRVVGIGIAIIMLMVIGIRYMTESVEGKAEMKKKVPFYVLGAIILFSASEILKIVGDFATKNIKAS